jgi:sugar lactone lactonase YvrE
MRKTLYSIAIVAGIPLLYLLFWPVSIDPVMWTPPEAPKLTGIYEVNSRLASVERLGVGAGTGPEDVAIDTEGRIYAGMVDGRIMRFQSDGSRPEIFADTGGRPLGLRFDSQGNLIVCDASKGLLLVATNGSITTLSTETDGRPYKLTDDLDIAADGTIYFTDASYKYNYIDHLYDFLEHGSNGRLIAYDPANKRARTLLDKLHFANGVAMSPDQSFVLVVESSEYQVQRYWLAGPKKGTAEVFINNLPGVPDGISSNGKGKFWLALASTRDSRLDSSLPRPFLRKITLRIPKSLWPSPSRYSFILGLDIDGKVTDNFQDPSNSSFSYITNVVEHDGTLYLGSLVENSIARLKL